MPGLNCYSCPGAVGACPLGALQNALAASGHRAGWYVLGILLLYGVILGRTICGWLCQLGLMQELLHGIPTLKIRKSRITRMLSWLKYAVLAVFVFAITLWHGLANGVPLPAFCKYICPAGTLEGAVGLLSSPANAEKFSMLNILFTGKFVVMTFVGPACVFCYRSFCRFLCPLGAIYGLFSRFHIGGVKVDGERCNGCGACVLRCGMDVRRVGDHECIQCGECMEVCRQKVISIRAGSVTLSAPEGGCAGDAPDAPQRRRRLCRIVWAAALALLCFALLWYNALDPSLRKASEWPDAAAGTPAQAEEPAAEAPAASLESDAPPWNKASMRLPDFTAACVDGTEFRLADARGKVTFINLWATYCGPCVEELPHFSALYREHEGDIAMLAVHSSLTMDSVEDYLKDKDWAMLVAVDTDDDAIWNLVGGSSTLPQTIVLNRKGEVVYNETRSLTPEMLEALYGQAEKAP